MSKTSITKVSTKVYQIRLPMADCPEASFTIQFHASALPDLAHAVADAMAEAMRGLPEKPQTATWDHPDACDECYTHPCCCHTTDPTIHAGERG